MIDALPAARLDHVFTHTSWAPDRASSYERLEFLGDSVLELAIARALYDRFPDASEGRLAKIRAHVVSRQSCAGVAKELDLGKRLIARARDVPEPVDALVLVPFHRALPGPVALGLLPLAIGTGEAGREIEGPMAIVILGGLITSTLLNLLVLPALALRYGKFEKARAD